MQGVIAILALHWITAGLVSGWVQESFKERVKEIQRQAMVQVVGKNCSLVGKNCSLSINWNFYNGDAHSYLIQYREPQYSMDWQEAVVNDTKNYVIENLRPETSVDVQVFIYDGEVRPETETAHPRSPYIFIGNVWGAMTERGTPLAPLNVNVTEITSDSALISWNQNPQDPRSVLRWKVTYYNPYKYSWSYRQVGGSELSYRLSGLQSSKDYVVRIQGFNQYGIGEYSKTTFSTTFNKETEREGKLCGEGTSVDYVGTKNVTKSGFDCQNWDSDEFHVRSRFIKKLVKRKQQMNGVLYLEKNYCRNPSQNWGGTWCYTTNPNKRWENCAIPKCTEAEETRYKPCKSSTDCSKGYDDHKGYVCTWLGGAGKNQRSICTIGVKGFNFYGKN